MWARRILIGCALLFAVPVGHSQAPATDSFAGLPLCAKADLNIRFQFFRERDSLALSVLGENISDHACAFDGSLFYPSVQGATSTPPMTNGTTHPFPGCPECGLVNGRPPANPRPAVAPRQVAREGFRWGTVPTPGPVQCLDGGWFASPSYFLVSASLLHHICTDITRTELDVLADPEPDDAADDLHLSVPKTSFDDGESVPLHVTGNLSTDQGACPTFFVWHRGPDGSTRMDEMPKRESSPCPADNDLLAGVAPLWSGSGEHRLQVFAMASPSKPGAVSLIPSNVVTIRIIDPLSVSRTWFRVKGLGSSIALDKDTYKVGEDIPLHMAIANFDAAPPVYSWDPVWDPCTAVSVQVLQADGNVLPRSEAFQSFSLCTGHGFGPRPFPAGKIVPIERDLRSEGLLPRNPGTYIVVLRWSVSAGSVDQKQTGWNDHLTPYANVKARAVIHIIPAV